jgi:hypothetical protein
MALFRFNAPNPVIAGATRVSTPMYMFLGLAVTAAVPAYFVVQPMSLATWRGGWRKAALAPLLLTLPALLFSLYALGKGSDLWPITLIFAAAIGSLYLAALWLAQRWLTW